MDWIKKNYDQFILALIGVVLLGLSGLLIARARAFDETFASLQGDVRQNNTIPPVPTDELKAAEQAIEKPPTWARRENEGSLFVSRKYILKDGNLINIMDEEYQVHPPVPNSWFIEHKMADDILNDDVLDEDPDGDGFTNLDEYLGKTDPQDKNSHPSYLTKLFLDKFIKKPFRLRFEGSDGDTFQINTLDLQQPSQFLKIGEKIVGTKFKIDKYESKHEKDANDIDHDTSELTIENTETSEKVILVLDKDVDSPDSYALFGYFWNFPTTHQKKEFQVKKNQNFTIEPEKDRQYKVVDIQETEAVIQDLTKPDKLIKIPIVPANETNPIHPGF